MRYLPHSPAERADMLAVIGAASAEALFAGPDGLDDYRRLAPEVGRLLARGGLAAIEIGFDQAESAAALFAAQGPGPGLARDLAGRPRALTIAARQ